MPYVVVEGRTWYGATSSGTLELEPHPNMMAMTEVWSNVDSTVAFNKDIWDVSVIASDTVYTSRPKVRFLRKVSTGRIDAATMDFSTTEFKVIGRNDSVIAEDEREMLVDGGKLFIQEEPKRNTYVHVINDGKVEVAQNGHCLVRLTQGSLTAEEECQISVDAYGTSTVNISYGLCRLHEFAECNASGLSRVIAKESNLVVASGRANVICEEDNNGVTVHASEFAVVDACGMVFATLNDNAILRVCGDIEFVEATTEAIRHEAGRAIVFIKGNGTVITQDGTRYTKTGISYAPSVKTVTTGDALKAVVEAKPHSHTRRGNPSFKGSKRSAIDDIDLDSLDNLAATTDE